MSIGSNDPDYNALWMLEKNTQDLEMRTPHSGPNLRKSYRWKLSSLGSRSSAVAQPDSGEFVRVQLPEYICSNCDKKYKWLDSLKRHQRVECGNKAKKFSCHMCDRKFKYRYEMRNHISLTHGILS